MSASAAVMDRGLESNRGVARANQLLEAGLWLRLGGDEEGARRLFTRALAQDPSNRRAREWLAKSPAAPAARPASAHVARVTPLPVRQPVRPVAPVQAAEPQVVVLSDGDVDASREKEIPEDVLAYLAGSGPAAMMAPVSRPQATPPRQGVVTLMKGVEELLALGDVSSAMELVGKAEQLAPAEARVADARSRIERARLATLEAKLGDLKRVPTLKLRMQDLMKLQLDPRAGFMLSRIDGRLSYEALFAVSGMSRQDTIRVLGELVEQGIIG